MSSSPTQLDQVIIPLVNGKTVLDVGCGYGRWATLIHSNYWEAGLKNPPIVDGIDAFMPNVKFCSKIHAYRKVWLQKMPSELKGKWDVVLACEILEHLPQSQVDAMLDVLEKAADKRVIISTPNWPSFRGGSHTKLGYNKYEAHLSYISQEYLKKRGYKVLSVGFANPYFFPFRIINWFLSLFRKKSNNKNHSHESVSTPNYLFRAFDTLPLIMPSLGHSTIAYKDVK